MCHIQSVSISGLLFSWTLLGEFNGDCFHFGVFCQSILPTAKEKRRKGTNSCWMLMSLREERILKCIFDIRSLKTDLNNLHQLSTCPTTSNNHQVHAHKYIQLHPVVRETQNALVTVTHRMTLVTLPMQTKCCCEKPYQRQPHTHSYWCFDSN